MPVPARPAPHLVVGQPDLLLGRLEGALDRPACPAVLANPVNVVRFGPAAM